MKIKHLLAAVNCVLILAAVIEMLPVPPQADTVLPVYKSGYFRELDEKCLAAAEGFLAVKTLGSRPGFAWTFLEDLNASLGLKVSVYDSKGRLVPFPGSFSRGTDEDVRLMLSHINPKIRSKADGGIYKTLVPMEKKAECGICHKGSRGSLLGILAFEQNYDAYMYYSKERIPLFGGAAIALIIALFFILRFDSGINKCLTKTKIK